MSLKHMILLVLLLAPLCYSWDTCGGKGVKINTFSVEDCSESADVCQLKRGTNQTISVTFTPQQDLKMLNLTVDATMVMFHKAFPFNSTDICQSKNVHCPMKKGFEQTFVYGLYLDDKYPDVRVQTRWSFVSSDGTLQGCFKESFQIVH